MIQLKYVYIVYEITRNKEYIFGIFSSEILAIKASAEFKVGEFRVEKLRLDP